MIDEINSPFTFDASCEFSYESVDTYGDVVSELRRFAGIQKMCRRSAEIQDWHALKFKLPKFY